MSKTKKLALWTLIAIVAVGVCGFTLEGPPNPLQGFITTDLFFFHIILGLIAIGLAVATFRSIPD